MASIGFPACERERTDKIISLRDKRGGKSNYIGLNHGKNITQIEIDGCVFNELDGRKCDYLLLNNNDRLSYLIELKGSSLGDSYHQIADTLGKLLGCEGFRINVFEKKYRALARVVLAKGNVPGIIPSSYNKLLKIIEKVNREKVIDGIHIKRIKSGQEEIL